MGASQQPNASFDSASMYVLDEVAAHTGLDPLELPPLFEVIDPDSLDVLVSSVSSGEVSFWYANCRVTIRSSGAIDVSD